MTRAWLAPLFVVVGAAGCGEIVEAKVEDGVESSSETSCTPSGEGVWADCVDGESCMSPESVCASLGGGEGGCLFACETDCDCPPSPSGGVMAAQPLCVDFTGPGGMVDGNPECYLDCANGEQCPEGQYCWANLACVHTNDVGVYEGCATAATPSIGCPDDSFCVVDSNTDPTLSSCLPSECTVAADCPDVAGGTVECDDVVGGPSLECYIDCELAPCPEGWQCHNGICLQPYPG